MPSEFLFLVVGTFLLIVPPIDTAVKSLKHFHGQQKPSTSKAVPPFDYDYPDYSAGVFIDAVPITSTTKKSLAGHRFATPMGLRRKSAHLWGGRQADRMVRETVWHAAEIMGKRSARFFIPGDSGSNEQNNQHQPGEASPRLDSSTIRILQLELRSLQSKPMEGFTISCDENNISAWTVGIFGPPGTPYQVRLAHA
uniref:UBC core domain-containing protein n=1 Tax=Globodera rostochiensis TaxID=31243 RepID=A0A914IB58_GLORO